MMSLTCTCSIHGSTSRLDSSSVGRINPCSLDNEMQTEAIWASKRQTADSCFGLVGPHQRRVCLVALRRPRVTYSKANSNGQGRGNETTLAPCRANQANGGQLFRAGCPSSACTYIVCLLFAESCKHTQKVLCNFLPSDTTWRSKTCRHS